MIVNYDQTNFRSTKCDNCKDETWRNCGDKCLD